MTPKEFVNTLMPYAKACEEKTGVNALVILAQAALESGWGRFTPGNMYFGVKDSDGINGNEQLIRTTEYSRRSNCSPKEVGLVDIESVKPVSINGGKFFKYIGHAYFRKYASPEESFIDHAKLFVRAPVYAPAMLVRDNPEKFIDEMSKHYATAPDYATILLKIYKQVKSLAVLTPVA